MENLVLNLFFGALGELNFDQLVWRGKAGNCLGFKGGGSKTSDQ